MSTGFLRRFGLHIRAASVLNETETQVLKAKSEVNQPRNICTGTPVLTVILAGCDHHLYSLWSLQEEHHAKTIQLLPAMPAQRYQLRRMS